MPKPGKQRASGPSDYDRNECALSLADGFPLAQAVADGAQLATADPPIATVARQLDVDVIGLPDTAGRRP